MRQPKSSREPGASKLQQLLLGDVPVEVVRDWLTWFVGDNLTEKKLEKLTDMFCSEQYDCYRLSIECLIGLDVTQYGWQEVESKN